MKSTIRVKDVEINPSEQLRIVTLNVLHFTKDIELRASLMISETLDLDPEILCLQEVPFEDFSGNSKYLDEVEKHTNLRVVAKKFQKVNHEGVKFGVAILAVRSLSRVEVIPRVTHEEAALSVLKNEAGQLIAVFTSHLYWGAENEAIRLHQVVEIDKAARKLQCVYEEMGESLLVFYAGDFNALPDSDSMRFLKGSRVSDRGASTFWLDSWEVASSYRSTLSFALGDGDTVSMNNRLAREIAEFCGIKHTSLLPGRRIDYIYSLGWNYGRPGSALESKLVFMKSKDEISASDHYGVCTDFLIG